LIDDVLEITAKLVSPFTLESLFCILYDNLIPMYWTFC
jgi:hypothetical protein